MTRQMADDEVLRVLRQGAATLCDLGAPVTCEGVIDACTAVAALQAERDALRDADESMQQANHELHQQIREHRAALEALRGQVAGLAADAYAAGWVVCAQWARREDLVHDIGSGEYAEERDAALLAIKERMG